MIYTKKIKNSKIIETKIYSKKSLGIKNHRQKIFNYIFSLVLIGFTIISKFVLGANELFINIVVFLVMKIVSTILLSYFGKSIFSKNHRVIYEILKFVNHFSKAMVLLYSILAFVYATLTAEVDGMIFTDAIMHEGFFYSFGQVIKNNPGKFLMLLVNLVLLFIEWIWFLIKYFKFWFFPVNAIFYFKWLFNNKLIFYEYLKDENDKDKVIENKREIEIPGYAKREIGHKLLISAAVLVVLVLLGLEMYYL